MGTEKRVRGLARLRRFPEICRGEGRRDLLRHQPRSGEKTTEFVTGNLRAAGFPLKAETNLTVLRDTSNKAKRQDEILASYDLVVFLGNNLNDFRRKY